MATADGRMFVIGGESGEPSAKDDSMMVHVLDTSEFFLCVSPPFCWRALHWMGVRTRLGRFEFYPYSAVAFYETNYCVSSNFFYI